MWESALKQSTSNFAVNTTVAGVFKNTLTSNPFCKEQWNFPEGSQNGDDWNIWRIKSLAKNPANVWEKDTDILNRVIVTNMDKVT